MKTDKTGVWWKFQNNQDSEVCVRDEKLRGSEQKGGVAEEMKQNKWNKINKQKLTAWSL